MMIFIINLIVLKEHRRWVKPGKGCVYVQKLVPLLKLYSLCLQTINLISMLRSFTKMNYFSLSIFRILNEDSKIRTNNLDTGIIF